MSAARGSLRGGPELESAIVVVCEAVLRLHGSVGEKRIVVSSFDGFGGGLKSGGCVAIFAKSYGGRLLREFVSLLQETIAGLPRGRAFVPSYFESFAGGLGLPPSVAKDGHAGMETEEVVGAGKRVDVANARDFFDFVEIAGDEFAAEDGTFLVHGPQHVRNTKVDGVERLAGDDGKGVDATSRVADDFVVLGTFECDGFEIGG